MFSFDSLDALTSAIRNYIKKRLISEAPYTYQRAVNGNELEHSLDATFSEGRRLIHGSVDRQRLDVTAYEAESDV